MGKNSKSVEQKVIEVPVSIKESWIWDIKPFSKGQALIDLYLCAADESTIYARGDVVHSEKGQLVTNTYKLAVRWGWSRSKLFNYLALLEGKGIIQAVSEYGKYTIINILKDFKDISEKTFL